MNYDLRVYIEGLNLKMKTSNLNNNESNATEWKSH